MGSIRIELPWELSKTQGGRGELVGESPKETEDEEVHERDSRARTEGPGPREEAKCCGE